MPARRRCGRRLVPISSPARPASRRGEAPRETTRHALGRRGELRFVRDAHSPSREWASFISVKIDFFFKSEKIQKNKKYIYKNSKIILAVYSRFLQIFNFF